MSEGATIALVLGGVAVVGAGAYFVLYRQPSTSVAGSVGSMFPPGYSTAQNAPTAFGAPPPAPSATSQLMSGINGLNQTGCQAAAAKVGAGGLAAIGCSDFLKYATPLGLAQVANGEITKIPVVGPAIGKVETAASNLVNKPISAVKGAVSKVLSFF